MENIYNVDPLMLRYMNSRRIYTIFGLNVVQFLKHYLVNGYIYF
jgi:hypothetical protein